MKNEWEDRLHKELKNLPGLKAPASLLPRVMAAVETRTLAPWWSRPWWTWALPARLAFVSVVMLAAGLALKAGHDVFSGLQIPQLPWGASLAADFCGHCAVFLNALWTVWWALRQPLLAAAALLYLTCIAFGTALVQVAANSIKWRLHET